MYPTSGGPELESSVSLMVALFNGKRGLRLTSVMVRTEDALAAGGYEDPRYSMLDDTGNWGKVVLRFDYAACIPRPLVRYRVHAGSHTSAGVCEEWQEWGPRLHADLVAVLEEKGDREGARRLMRARKNLMANLTSDVLLRGKGSPGWAGKVVREAWRSRSFMLTPYVAGRVLRDGWKMLRLK